MQISEVTIGNILTRTTGYLKGIASHSLQPYRGCAFGRSLCGVGCYVQHNRHVVRGREWGTFLEVRLNAAEAYRKHYHSERRRAHRRGEAFGIFCSSASEPFVPQEKRYGITRSVLEAMISFPPDVLVLQTHSPRVSDVIDLLRELAERCRLRVHVSVETDREKLPGLPPPAFSVEARLEACCRLKSAGLQTVVTVAPLLPLENPHRFFADIAQVADAVVLDHFIEGDGSPNGSRTRRTALPTAMAALCPGSVSLSYREEMAAIARRYLPGRVGIHRDGFAGRYT